MVREYIKIRQEIQNFPITTMHYYVWVILPRFVDKYVIERQPLQNTATEIEKRGILYSQGMNLYPLRYCFQ